jgi:hypothetical protein
MDLTRSHYRSDGRLFVYDEQKRDIVETRVQYENPSPYAIDAGLNTRVGGLIPKLDFQRIFLVAFFEIFDQVQKAGYPLFQFDKNRLSNFTGQGFIDGDLSFFLERSDKPDEANYRCEFRATLAVNHYDGSYSSLTNEFRKEMLKIKAKE